MNWIVGIILYSYLTTDIGLCSAFPQVPYLGQQNRNKKEKRTIAADFSCIAAFSSYI